jgi:XTP/dITP diphosphohydrolase
VTAIPSRIVLATRNPGKVREIQDLVAGLPVIFLSLTDLAGAPEVVEDGVTFEENALKKARTIAAISRMPAVADDSGLCVDALHGRPGVYSARYGGENAPDEDKCRRLLQELADVPTALRSARFVCAVAFVTPDREDKIFTGTCEGQITPELRGQSGFGYDPIFYHPESGKTFAEMDRDAKNRVSHRGKALAEFARYLRALAA